MTTGAVLDRFPLSVRAKLSAGLGYHLTFSQNTTREPLTPQYRNNFIFSTSLALGDYFCAGST
jgi:hypothetical protein